MRMFKLSLADVRKAAFDDGDSYCVECGELYDGGFLEPDARKVLCNACGKKAVYNVNELMVMGLVEITGEGGDLQ